MNKYEACHYCGMDSDAPAVPFDCDVFHSNPASIAAVWFIFADFILWKET